MNKFTTDVNETIRWGYTLGTNKGMLDDKLRLNVSATYFLINVNGAAQNKALSVNGRVGYVVKEQHTFDVSFNLITRNTINSTTPGTRDLLANFGYTYAFGGKKL